jgi:enterochelin esterase-like enzyme
MARIIDLARRVRRSAPLVAALSLVAACAGVARTPVPPSPVSLDGPSPGRFVTVDAFPSAFVAARRVVVWVPPGYDSGDERYAVLYMHDGQNLFDPATSMARQPWAVDRHLDALMRAGRVRPTIVVGVWNTATRSQDYAPAAPLAGVTAAARAIATPHGAPAFSDGYVRFLAEELKPWVDAHFRTRPGPKDTAVMGSSMGGLISLYALASRPDVFGAAGALSTHWVITTDPLLDRLRVPGAHDARVDELALAYLDWLRLHLPPPGTHRLYFDHGTEHLDSLYGPYQARMDAIVAERGYRPGVDVLSLTFPGATHNEPAWRARLAEPLAFLLAP